MLKTSIVDYLIPVGDAGDKSFTNGTQDLVITAEQQKKADELIKQIALKKQLDLERGNTAEIMRMLQSDTPEAAIYRALLLQQLEQGNINTQSLKKKDEDNQPGVIRRTVGWIGNKALSTAKYMGMAALTHLALKSLFSAGDIARDGLIPTWKKWQVENGIAKTPELAEKTGDQYAALGDDIVKRNVKLKDVSGATKAELTKRLDKLNGKPINMSKATISLGSIFRNGDNYVDSIPKDANPEEYSKEWAYFLNTGEKGSSPIPISKQDLGINLFNNVFKTGQASTIISPDDHWFMQNPGVRYIDNSVFHIGQLSGYNAKKRLNSKYAMPYNGIRKEPKEEKPPESVDEDKEGEYNEEKINDREQADREKATQENMETIAGNTKSSSSYGNIYYDIEPGDLEKFMESVENLDPKNQADILKFKNSCKQMNTVGGIPQNEMQNFLNLAFKIQKDYPGDSKEAKQNRLEAYKNLISISKTGKLHEFINSIVGGDPVVDTIFSTKRPPAKGSKYYRDWALFSGTGVATVGLITWFLGFPLGTALAIGAAASGYGGHELANYLDNNRREEAAKGGRIKRRKRFSPY